MEQFLQFSWPSLRLEAESWEDEVIPWKKVKIKQKSWVIQKIM